MYSHSKSLCTSQEIEHPAAVLWVSSSLSGFTAFVSCAQAGCHYLEERLCVALAALLLLSPLKGSDG